MSLYDDAMGKDAREGNLPVWAQRKLDALRAVASRARTDLEETLLKSSPEESDAILNPYGNIQLGTPPQGLGPRPDVRFPLRGVGARSHIDARVTGDRRWLYVCGDARLYVVTDASNALRIRSTDEPF